MLRVTCLFLLKKWENVDAGIRSLSSKFYDHVIFRNRDEKFLNKMKKNMRVKKCDMTTVEN